MPTERFNMIVTLQDRASKGLGGIAKQIGGIAVAYIALDKAMQFIGESITQFGDYEASLAGIGKVADTTGRDTTEIYKAMQSQLTGMADKASIASTFLKGLTTTLDVQQINNMTTAIRDASLAMGEDFNVQLPMIIKAVKQLNPAILDNIGVTVRLDEVNKRIRDGFYGAGRAINETTQQHAIYTEIMKQTAKFQGIESTMMGTTKGQAMALTSSINDLKLAFGDLISPGTEFGLAGLSGIVKGINSVLSLFIDDVDELSDIVSVKAQPGTAAYAAELNSLNTAYKEGRLTLEEYKEAFENIGTTSDQSAAKTNQLTQQFINNQNQAGNSLDRFAGFYIDSQSGMVDALRIRAEEEKAASDAAINAYMELMGAAEELAVVLDFPSALKTLADIELEELPEMRNIHEEIRAIHADTNDYLNGLLESRRAKGREILDDEVEAAREAARKQGTTYQSLSFAMQVSMRNAVGRMVGSLKFLQTESSGIFKNMLSDFVTLFIEEALNILAVKFVTGFMKILASILDTRANDLVVIGQGTDFGNLFAMGAYASLQNNMTANKMFPPLPGEIPFMGGGGSDSGFAGGGGTTINFNHPLTSEEYVRAELAPLIESEAIEGLINIETSKGTITGASHGILD